MTRNIGVILLAVWLIIYALLAITNVEFAAAAIIQGCLAGAAGIFLLIGK